MKATRLAISDVIVLEPSVHTDRRGFFYETYNEKKFNSHTGKSPKFIQHNHSRSYKGVLRGLHYQLPPSTQAKLIRVTYGEIFDVAVDLRTNSSTFKEWVGVHLSAQNKKELWIPEGFAHGFLTISEYADVIYYTTNLYDPENERCIHWADPSISIAWPSTSPVIQSEKDKNGLLLTEAELF